MHIQEEAEMPQFLIYVKTVILSERQEFVATDRFPKAVEGIPGMGYFETPDGETILIPMDSASLHSIKATPYIGVIEVTD